MTRKRRKAATVQLEAARMRAPLYDKGAGPRGKAVLIAPPPVEEVMIQTAQRRRENGPRFSARELSRPSA